MLSKLEKPQRKVILNMAQAVYLLCAFTSITCAILLFKSYRINRSQLLLWSSLCFGLLSLNNITLMIDLVLLPEIDFYGAILRNLMGALAGITLVFGLVWEIS